MSVIVLDEAGVGVAAGAHAASATTTISARLIHLIDKRVLNGLLFIFLLILT
jgi:hypothetical protein